MRNIKYTRTGTIHRICHVFGRDNKAKFYDSICGVVAFGKGAMPPAAGRPDFRECYELTNKGVTCRTCLRILRSKANRKYRKKKESLKCHTRPQQNKRTQ